MKTLRTLVRFEFRLLLNYGLIPAGVLLSCMWLAMLSFFPREAMPIAVPLVLLTDLATMGYMFIASMIYFEKGQGSIYAMMTSPISVSDYIKSKIIALLIYTIAVSLIVVQGIAMIKELKPNYGILLLSIFLTAVIHMLLGILFAARFESFTDFLFPTGGIFMVLLIPMLGFLDLPALAFMRPLYYLWPTHGLILLLRGIVAPISMGHLLYGLLYNLLLCQLLYKASVKAFNQRVIGREGDIDG